MENPKEIKTNNQDERKSILIAIGIYGVIIAILFFIRFWPPYGKSEELIAQGGGGGGVMVNFGDSELGKGDDYLSETLEVNMQESTPTPPQESEPEQILTQDEVGAEINTPKKIDKPKEIKKPDNTKPVTQTVTNPTPVKKTNSALTNMLKGKNKGGDGDDNAGGNKGSLNGDPYSNSYNSDGGSGGGSGGGHGTGNGTGTGSGTGPGSGGGSGGGTNYKLAGRTPRKPDVDNTCNSFGKVVIEITVDRAGNTINAVNGKGTKADACLISLAKSYAMRTKWSPSDTAAEKQVGTITYNFTNSN